MIRDEEEHAVWFESQLDGLDPTGGAPRSATTRRVDHLDPVSQRLPGKSLLGQPYLSYPGTVNARASHLATAQARSVLARATSGYARWLDPEAAERHGSLVTAIYLDHPLRPICRHRSPMVLEVCDPAPVPVRDRVRARVRLFGEATRSNRTGRGIHIRPVSVHLETSGDTVTLNPLDLWQAEPDPLALAEAGLLGHLDSCHPETVELLARHIPDEVRAHARRIAPVALDGGGIVLRVEHVSGHNDIRLAFDRDVTDPSGVVDAMAALLGIGGRPPAEVKESRRHDLLAALMEAGPAAARICAPGTTTSPSTRDTAH